MTCQVVDEKTGKPCGAETLYVDYGNAEIFQCTEGHRQPKGSNR